MHVIAAKAVCFAEAAKDSFVKYQQQVINNSAAFASALSNYGFHLVSGGSDNHLMLVDLRPSHPELTGKQGQIALDGANVTLNRNTVPGETRSPFQTSGLRIGTPAVTSRGMKEDEMSIIASIIHDVLKDHANESNISSAQNKALALCNEFPLPY
jgi:glycine hydroxymethyltransferase